MLPAYRFARDWVDDLIRRPGSAHKATLLPAMILPLIAGVLGAPQPVLFAAIALAILWTGFVAGRFLVYLKEASRQSDEHYDSHGNCRFSDDYHDTESATAAAGQD